MNAADALLEKKDVMARQITDMLYAERPALLERYGVTGKARCLEDMHYNLEHLAPAVALGEKQLFERYVVWLRDMLGARNVPADDVRRSLQLTVQVLQEQLAPEHAAAAVDVVRAGIAVLDP